MDNDALWGSYARSLRLRKRSPETIEVYQSTVGLLRRWSKDAPLLEMTRQQLEEFVEYRMSIVGDVTLQNNVLMLKVFFTWCVAEELLEVSPLKRIPKPTIDDKLPRVLSAAEVKALMQTCAGKSFYDRRDSAMFRLLMTVGSPRLSELMNMRMDSVDMESGLVTVTGKTGTRTFPVTDQGARSLELYLRVRSVHVYADLDAFWIGYKGGLTRRGIADLLHRRAAQAGIGRTTPHMFRHTVTSMAQEAGMSDSTLEPLMGWKPGSGMASKIYGRATRVRRAQDASRRLGDLI